jgi:cytochrome bd-type quinol oxidase subunit 1
LFTLLGFMGLYTLLAILFLYLVRHEVARGPAAAGPAETGVPISVT